MEQLPVGDRQAALDVKVSVSLAVQNRATVWEKIPWQKTLDPRKVHLTRQGLKLAQFAIDGLLDQGVAENSDKRSTVRVRL